MSEVRKWLDTIGLAQYADAFETNDLDIDLLGQIDDQLLKDIGVSSAIALRMRRPSPAKLNQEEKSVSSLGTATDAGSASAERRQVKGRRDERGHGLGMRAGTSAAGDYMLRDLSTSRSHKPERARSVLLSALLRYDQQQPRSMTCRSRPQRQQTPRLPRSKTI
jgi:hypothetical protein